MDEDSDDAKLEGVAADAVAHYCRRDNTDRYQFAATAETPFSVDEIDEKILVE